MLEACASCPAWCELLGLQSGAGAGELEAVGLQLLRGEGRSLRSRQAAGAAGWRGLRRAERGELLELQGVLPAIGAVRAPGREIKGAQRGRRIKVALFPDCGGSSVAHCCKPNPSADP